jgi:hypothetical protein
MAENGNRIKDIFINQDYPKEGLIAVKLFIKGKPEIVSLDDILPFYNSNPFFAKRSGDGDFWMAFLEKAYAKLSGNYEAIISGWQSEAFRILNGAPSKFFMMSSQTASAAWTTITNALNNGNLVGVDTGSNPPFGLVGGHAHTIVSTHVLKSSTGAIVQRLYRVRNPWGQDSYTGAWYDGDTRWTSAYKAQVPYINSNDGYFFISDADLITGFYYFTVNYYNPGWNVNYYERLNDDGS